MMYSPALQARTSMTPVLSPRLQRAVRLLQMSSLDFAQLVRQALDTNPFLESLETDAPSDDSADEAVDPLDDALAPPEALWEADLPAARRADAGEGTAFDTLAAPTTLAGHLASQLNVLSLSDRDRVLALALAHSLDEDGYLRTPLDEVGAALGLWPAPDLQELSIALRRVQALDPAGVGARDLAECLLLQLALLPLDAPRADHALATRIVRHHLPALAAGDLATLARQLGAPHETVQAACDTIRHLDPRPGWRHGTQFVAYVTPDVVVSRHQGQWVTRLNPAVVPRVRLNRPYAQWFQHQRASGHAQLGADLQEAKWTVRNVEQRFATILAVARAILQRQHRFLALGPMAMRPLALREIADAVGMHESTVSRVTNNKFMATPCGVFEFKYFFSRRLATASGGECSPTAIRTLIRELIAAEGARAPLTDVALAQMLAGQGLRVARRTVTKYRQQLKIAPAQRRHPTIR